MSAREYDEDDIGTLYFVAENLVASTERLEALGEDAPLAEVLEELDLLRTLLVGTFNHVTRMSNLMVRPYREWEIEHGAWRVQDDHDQADRLARAQARAERAKGAKWAGGGNA